MKKKSDIKEANEIKQIQVESKKLKVAMKSKDMQIKKK